MSVSNFLVTKNLTVGISMTWFFSIKFTKKNIPIHSTNLPPQTLSRTRGKQFKYAFRHSPRKKTFVLRIPTIFNNIPHALTNLPPILFKVNTAESPKIWATFPSNWAQTLTNYFLQLFVFMIVFVKLVFTG